jgi:EAL domain-containing protein (putative c-di-GMP-specific phosphodiesterase class I)
MVWDSKIQASHLEIEITESVLMTDIEETMVVLRAFKDAGLRIAIDDFGTGYSSLSYLKQFPVDYLKIDRSFVANIHTDGDDAAICAAIVAMAKKLNLMVIAEGVESEEQLFFLREQGCDQVQGFLFAKPMQADELARLFDETGGKVSIEHPPVLGFGL